MSENQDSPALLKQALEELLPNAKAVPPPPEPAAKPNGFSTFLQDFVTGREPQTTQWIRLASMVASQSFSCDVVVRVLRPKEKSASGNLPLDRLGISIARKVGAKYSPARLKRIQGTPENFVHDPSNPGAAHEAYKFDKSFLGATARILVISDEDPSSVTLDAIRAAVNKELPEAEIKSFTLQWLEEHFQSAPLDDRYFLSSESPLSVLSREANPHRPDDTPQLAQPDVVRLDVQPTPAEEKKAAAVKPVHVHPRRAKAKPAAPAVQNAKRSLSARSRMTLVFVAMAVLAVGILVLGSANGFLFRKTPSPMVPDYIPEPAEQILVEPVNTEAPKVQPVVESKPKGPRGIITVPSAGLRSGPSLSAKAVKTTVKNKERVTILKRRSADVGPDWVQIETKSGVVGWVWASVVKEQKRKL